MSTPALVFLILGIVFGILVLNGVIFALLVSRDAHRHTQSKRNLRQMALGLHNYHDVYNQFPPGGIYTSEDEPYNSWMTSLLPFVDQAPLFNQIDFDEPWTSQGNLPSCEFTVSTYINPAVKGINKVNGLGAAHYSGNSQLLARNKSMQIKDVTDGMSNTIMAGEVSTGFAPWGDPANCRDPAVGFGHTATQFGSVHAAGDVVNMLLIDGSVRQISVGADAEMMEAIASPAGGESVYLY